MYLKKLGFSSIVCRTTIGQIKSKRRSRFTGILDQLDGNWNERPLQFRLDIVVTTRASKANTWRN